MELENQNSCCFVAKIDEIKPILGADKIELAVLKGWQSIVQKDIHKVGDLVVLLSTDAVLPQAFAEKHGIVNYLRKGNRVKTVKLKGVYSECILISNNYKGSLWISEDDFEEGYDAMEDFGIFKYEEPVKQVQLSNGKKIKYKANPNFHVYYKFPNIKNVPGIFTEEDEVVITRKIHGTNARYGIVKKAKITLWDKIKQFFKRDPWWEYEYIYGSHNVEKGSDSQGFYDTDVWKDIAEKYDIKNKLWTFVKSWYSSDYLKLGSGCIFYGEIYGPGIQKGYDYNEKEHQIKFFDVEIDGEYLNDNSFRCTVDLLLDLEFCVEELYEGKWSKEVQDLYSKPVLIPNSKMYEEGIVIKTIDGNKRKRAKIVSQEYLIQQDKTDGTDFH